MLLANGDVNACILGFMISATRNGRLFLLHIILSLRPVSAI